MKSWQRISVALFCLAALSTGCAKKGASFSLLSDENNFEQNSATTNGKIDVLWVVDNSGSMESSQQNVATNFARFIEKFNAKGFDYRIAVTTSDAFMDQFGSPASQSQFRDGTDFSSHTGVFIIDPTTPAIESTFLTNIMQGIYGSGDERAFQSIRSTLLNPLNSGFPRADAFLSVIIVSDEDDFSHDGAESRGGQYSYSGLHSIDSYIEFLDGVTSASSTTRSAKYNVNSIAILDQSCLDLLNQSFGGRKIGYRYMQLSEQTNGVIGNLCGDFGTTMSEISNKIIQLTTQFYLDREPKPDSLQVTINESNVPRVTDQSPQPWNGFYYHSESNSVSFHGSFVPDSGAVISVKFDPVSLK